MFNLLCIRSAAIPRLKRMLDTSNKDVDEQMMLSDQLDHERINAARGAMENALRRNNLLPAVLAMFKGMGESGMMGERNLASATTADCVDRKYLAGGESKGEGEEGESETAQRGRPLTAEPEGFTNTVSGVPCRISTAKYAVYHVQFTGRHGCIRSHIHIRAMRVAPG